MCKRPWLTFWGWLTLIFKVKLNFKVKIYPSFSLWVCPRHKSQQIVVRISIFEPKMHLSTVKVLIDFGIDWASSSVVFLNSNLLFSTKLCVSYSFASVCIYLMRLPPVNAPHSTGHRTYTVSYMQVDRVPPWTVKQFSFISWWDHRSSMSRRLGDWHWILQAPIMIMIYITSMQL